MLLEVEVVSQVDHLLGKLAIQGSNENTVNASSASPSSSSVL
jgi:hypothetical protein